MINFAEDIEKYGYKIVKDFVNPNIKQKCIDIYDLDKENNKLLLTAGSHRVRNLFRVQEIQDIFNQELISELEKITKCPVILGGLSMNIVLPGSKGMNFHRDYPYYCIPKEFGDPDIPLGVQIIIALDDFTNDNGPTEFVPGSHYSKELTEELVNNTQKLLIKAGDALVMHSGTWHKVAPNITNENRFGILIDFHPYFIKSFNAQKHIIDKDLKEYSEEIQYLLGGKFIKHITEDFNGHIDDKNIVNY